MVNSALAEWHIELLNSTFERDSFDCGKEQLNGYLKNLASQNQKKGFAKTYIATSDNLSKKVIGYYSISTSSVKFESLPEDVRKPFPSEYPIPVVLLAKLAVDKTYRKKGLGKELLFHALHKAFTISKEIGVVAVTVDAIDEEAKQFYEKYSFREFSDRKLSLFLPMKVITKLFS